MFKPYYQECFGFLSSSSWICRQLSIVVSLFSGRLLFSDRTLICFPFEFVPLEPFCSLARYYIWSRDFDASRNGRCDGTLGPVYCLSVAATLSQIVLVTAENDGWAMWAPLNYLSCQKWRAMGTKLGSGLKTPLFH